MDVSHAITQKNVEELVGALNSESFRNLSTYQFVIDGGIAPGKTISGAYPRKWIGEEYRLFYAHVWTDDAGAHFRIPHWTDKTDYVDCRSVTGVLGALMQGVGGPNGRP